jgi:hypothetical protein
MGREFALGGRAVLHEIDGEDYETEIEKCSGVTGYHRWFFLKALSESLGLGLRAFAVEKGGSTIGVVPFVLRSRGPVSTSNFLPFPYVGPLVRDASYLDDVLAAADQFKRGRIILAMRWAFAPGSQVAAEPLTERGFQITTLENLVVPADRSPEEHLAFVTGRRRSYIRAWQDRGGTAGPADPAEIKEFFAEQVGVAYRRQGAVPPYSPDACRMIVDRLGTDPRMVWRASHDENGRLISVIANVMGADRLYFWLIAGGYDTKPSPQILAYWDTIQWSLNHGLAWDMGGWPSPGIRRFKAEFGGQSEPYCYADRDSGLEKFEKVRDLSSRIVRRVSRARSDDSAAGSSAVVEQ